LEQEQEKEKQNEAQISDANIIDDTLTEYRVYEHPLLPKRIVKCGFSWPALLVGPAYLIYRRLWIPVVVWIVAMALVRYFAISNYQYVDDGATVAQISEGAMLGDLVLLGCITNPIWEINLKNWGYVVTKSRRARSMDDVLAILEREKLTAHT
jgi:Protein of unknown function (DUF2628)